MEKFTNEHQNSQAKTIGTKNNLLLEEEKELQPAQINQEKTVNKLDLDSQKKSNLDTRLTNILQYLLDKQIHFVILALAFVYLTFSWFSTQSKFAQLQADNVEPSIVSLNKGSSAISFNRDSAKSRPTIKSNTGEKILEFNDLDNLITVNGVTTKLWDTDHNYKTDAANSRLYHEMNSGKWTLFQEVTLGPDPNRVQIEYYYRNDDTVSDVTLRLSHNQTYFTAPQLSQAGFKAQVSSGAYTSLEDQAANPRYSVEMKVNSGAFGNLPLVTKVEEGSNDKGGLTGILTTYNVRNIHVNQRTLVASEEITWQDSPLLKK